MQCPWVKIRCGYFEEKYHFEGLDKLVDREIEKLVLQLQITNFTITTHSHYVGESFNTVGPVCAVSSLAAHLKPLV